MTPGRSRRCWRRWTSSTARLPPNRPRPGCAQVAEALFTSPPAGYALLAWDGTQLAGLAAYSFLWPAVGLTRSLYLKELYVGGAYRRHGTGRLLMKAIFGTAAKHGCSRVEWTTGTGNTGAQNFYHSLGLPELPSKVFYRAEGADITRPALT